MLAEVGHLLRTGYDVRCRVHIKKNDVKPFGFASFFFVCFFLLLYAQVLQKMYFRINKTVRIYINGVSFFLFSLPVTR